MSGGAVVATVHDPSALWYNPAGLAAERYNRFDMTLSAYALRLRSTDYVLRSGDERNTSKIEDSSFVVMPSSIVYVRPLGKRLSAAVGLFAPVVDKFADIPSLDVELANRRVRASTRIDSEFLRYHGGVALGYALSPRLRLGFSVFGILEFSEDKRNGSLDVSPPGAQGEELANEVLVINDFAVESRRIGLESSFGMQYEAMESCTLGLMVRAPAYLIDHNLKSRQQISTLQENASPQTLINDGDVILQRHGLMLPWRIALGGAHYHGETVYSLEFSYDTGLTRPGIEIKPMWNARAGAKRQLTKNIALGVGLLSDRSSRPSPSRFYSERIHYYGGSLGVEINRPLKLKKKKSNSDQMSLRTTIGLRYTRGAGRATRSVTDVDAINVDGDVFTQEYRNVVFHDIAFQLGTAVSF